MDPTLAADTAALDDSYAAAVAAGQESIFDTMAKEGAKVSDEAIAKGLSGDYTGAAGILGAAGGIAVCSYLGAPMLAPVCGEAGKWAGERIGGVAKAIGEAVWSLFGGGGDSPSACTMYAPNLAAMNAKRGAILGALKLSGDDPLTTAAIKALAEKACPKAIATIGGKFGAGYGSFWAASPIMVSPQDFVDCHAYNPSVPAGSGQYYVKVSKGWQERVIRNLIQPFVDAGIPVAWAIEQLVETQQGQSDYWAVLNSVAQVMVPELDKVVANNLKYILEESAIRRNLKAAKAIKGIRARLVKMHPSWSAAQLDAAQEGLVRAVKSGDSTVVESAVKALSTDSASKGKKFKNPLAGVEADTEKETEKSNKGGGGAIPLAMAALAALVIMGRK